MTALELTKLAKFVQQCEAALATDRQSMIVFRGDMRAVVAAARLIQRHLVSQAVAKDGRESIARKADAKPTPRRKG